MNPSQITTIASICASTILILRFINDLKKANVDRQKEIREELKRQTERDASFDKHVQELKDLKKEFEEFQIEMRHEMKCLSNLIVDMLQFKRISDLDK